MTFAISQVAPTHLPTGSRAPWNGETSNTRGVLASGLQRPVQRVFLGGARSPSNWCPFTVSFLGEGSPTKISYGKKGTLILTSLLEDLEGVRFKINCQQYGALFPGLDLGYLFGAATERIARRGSARMCVCVCAVLGYPFPR